MIPPQYPGLHRLVFTAVGALGLLLFSGCAVNQGPSLSSAPPSVNFAQGSISLSTGWQLLDAPRVEQPGAGVMASHSDTVVDVGIRPEDRGQIISSPFYEPTQWYKATVPGTVLTSLVNDGVYPEPLYGENNRPDKIPEYLSRMAYWYRTQFAVPREFTGRQIWLNFAGINYTAEVWVNGHKAGEIKGAFARGTFNVTALVKPGAMATLAVKINPPPDPSDHAEKTVQAGTGGNGGILSKDGPTFICTQGWDWIPVIRDRDTGIWQNVTLTASGPVVLQDPYVYSRLPLPRTDFGRCIH